MSSEELSEQIFSKIMKTRKKEGLYGALPF